MKRTALLGLILALTWPAALAQEPVKWPISVSATSDDSVGKEFVYKLRSEIARSGMYRLAKEHEVALLGVSVLTISQQTDESGEPKNENNLSSAAAVIILLPQTDGSPRFLDSVIVLIGRDRTSAMAERTMVRIDENARAALRGVRRVLAP
jgi:hypothetical protein